MLLGLPAFRIRHLFQLGKKRLPCINKCCWQELRGVKSEGFIVRLQFLILNFKSVLIFSLYLKIIIELSYILKCNIYFFSILKYPQRMDIEDNNEEEKEEEKMQEEIKKKVKGKSKENRDFRQILNKITKREKENSNNS